MSIGEITLILVAYLLLFGAKGVPSLAQSLGKAVYQFRNAARDVQNEIMTSAKNMEDELNLDKTEQPRRPGPPIQSPPLHEDDQEAPKPRPDQEFS
jgi:sec-independent protein translocase protein TatA